MVREPTISASESRDGASNDIFVRDGDVYIRDSSTGAEQRITDVASSPEPDFRFDPSTITRSPDGNFAIVYKYTPDQGYTLNLVESTPSTQLQPVLHQSLYLKPGDKKRVERPCLFDLVAKTEIPVDSTLFGNPYSITEIGWANSSEEYRFMYNPRGQASLSVLGISSTGSVRAIIEERPDTFVNYFQKQFHSLGPDGTELLWASERSGWNHLYLVDLVSGEIKNTVTQGEWVVRSVDRVDWDTRQVWLTVYGFYEGQDPYYAHLARANIDDPSSSLVVLTQGNGTHTWTWSPDPEQSCLIDTFSRVDQLPITVLRSSVDGSLLATLEDDATPSLLEEGWTPPEIFVAPGRDGTTPIYGIILPPTTNFSPDRKYPVLEDIYASPHSFFCPKSFQTENDLSSQYELARAGFCVVKLDGMGTNWRSKKFHDVCWKNLKDGGIPDRIAWIKAAAEQGRRWMDVERVGIYGGSAGGQSAVAALVFHHDHHQTPDHQPEEGEKEKEVGFYKAAAADCGCHDNRLDKLWWNEQWMGWPVDASYEDNSNVVHAADLRGEVLLTVGEMDDNVDPASTLQLVKKLNEAGRGDQYEMMVFPGEGHGAGGGDLGRRRRARFFGRVFGGPVDV